MGTILCGVEPLHRQNNWLYAVATVEEFEKIIHCQSFCHRPSATSRWLSAVKSEMDFVFQSGRSTKKRMVRCPQSGEVR